MSEVHHHHSVTKNAVRNQVQVSSGLEVTGPRTDGITGGWRDAGTILPMKGHIGTIRTMITINRVGSSMKATGIMKTTTAITMTRVTITTITSLWIKRNGRSETLREILGVFLRARDHSNY